MNEPAPVPGRSGSRHDRGAIWGAVALLALATAGCSKGPLKCPAGQTACGGVCVDTTTDPDNCRFCTIKCPTGATCISSVCQCPAGQTACGPDCVTLTTAQNCGACGHGCGILGTCTTSTSPASCDCGSYTSCGAAVSPECVNTATDDSNCGGCGHVCGVGTCGSGSCTCTVSAGIINCGPGASPQCVDSLTDERNCGACGAICGTGTACSAGHCCPTGQTWCGTNCVDTSTDPSNCGGCGTICGTGSACSAGVCCASGLTGCGATCVNTSTDPSNCGSCGHACSAGQACLAGVCQCRAPVPLACGTNCCAGTGCCTGGTCQSVHSNGLGQIYYDCAPFGTPGVETTYDATMANEAATAWGQPGGRLGVTCGTATCIGFLTTGSPANCAVWCYTSTLAGYVGLSSTPTTACQAVCPMIGGGTTSPWN